MSKTRGTHESRELMLRLREKLNKTKLSRTDDERQRINPFKPRLEARPAVKSEHIFQALLA